MPGENRILLAHGGGGQLTGELVEQVILPALGGQQPGALTDSAALPAAAGELAFTTDSYVIWPLEFPGGDIGKLAVCGTINDLSVCGAAPIALSMALVLEEGLEMELLGRVLASAGEAARQAGVKIVTGDTKVVERGKCDGMYVNTSGVGVRLAQAQLGYGRIAPGDALIVNGTLGDHGLAIMSKREGLTFASDLQSDCASLHLPCQALVRELGEDLKFMRDLTRGGLAGVLAEVSRSSGTDIEIDESQIPASLAARSAADMLGLDILSVANEGKFLAIVSPQCAARAVEIMREFACGLNAAPIGLVSARSAEPLVEMRTSFGGRRVVQMPYGEELPRIC